VARARALQHARETAAFRSTGRDRLGLWAAAGLGVSLVVHGIAFFALDRVKLAFGIEQPVSTGPIRVDRVETSFQDLPKAAPPDQIAAPPPKDLAPLLDDVDLLDKLPEKAEIEMRPDVLKPEFAVKLGNPAKKGDPDAASPEPVAGLDLDAGLPDLGKTATLLPAAADGQIVVDPGSALPEDGSGNRLTDNLLQKGARGSASDSALDGSLDDMLGLPANVLVNKTTMLPSDLLFEYNSATLRESAKVGLMKLGLLIDRNPALHCWIEGHTDLIGGDEFNLDLSRRRADAVKEYLVRSLRIDGAKIHTAGFGKRQPLVPGGSITEQAQNRRVEIKMRPSAPPVEQAPPVEATPPAAKPVVETPPAAKPAPEPPAPAAKPVPAAKPAEEPEPPKAVLVKPKRALPVVEDPEPAPPPKASVPRAEPVDEPAPIRAQPVDEDAPPPARAVPQALPVDEDEGL